MSAPKDMITPFVGLIYHNYIVKIILKLILKWVCNLKIFRGEEMPKTPYKIEKPEDLTICKIKTEEQEISICLGREDNKISIFVNDNTWVTKIKKLWAKTKNLNSWEIYATKDKEGNVIGYLISAPKKVLCLRTGDKIEKNFTEEQKENFVKNAQRGRKKKI